MSSHDITVLGFAIILAGLIGTEVTARTGRAGVPTFAQVVTRVMRTRTGRVGILIGWAWLGLHFFAKLSSAQERRSAADSAELSGSEPDGYVWPRYCV